MDQFFEPVVRKTMVCVGMSFVKDYFREHFQYRKPSAMLIETNSAVKSKIKKKGRVSKSFIYFQALVSFLSI